MTEERHELVSSGGVRVAAWSAVPECDAIGTVVLCHGLATGADDDGTFLPLRDRLLRRGLGVIRFDARCHGETGGDWNRLSLGGWRDDVCAAIGLARRLPGERLSLLATSFAGGPAIAAVLDHARDCAGIVFWNPVLDYSRIYLSDEFRYGAEILSSQCQRGLPDWASYELPWVPVPLSRKLVAEMRTDETPRRAARLPCPGVVIHGTADPFVNVAASRDVVAGAPRLKLRTIPLARHGFRGLRPAVRAYSARWLARTGSRERAAE